MKYTKLKNFEEYFLECGWDITKKELKSLDVNGNVNFQLFLKNENGLANGNGYFIFKNKKDKSNKKQLIMIYYNLVVCFFQNTIPQTINPNNTDYLSNHLISNNISNNNKEINQWIEKDKSIHFQFQFIVTKD